MILVTVNPQELCIYYIVASHRGHRHMVPVLRRLRQECCLKFEASLGHKDLVSRKSKMNSGVVTFGRQRQKSLRLSWLTLSKCLAL